MAVVSDADFDLGILQSRAHQVRALALGTQPKERESGFRYTTTTCFDTFPFPELTEKQESSTGGAARELHGLRNNWLNPPEWTREEVLEFPGSVDGPWARYIDPNTVRWVKCPHPNPLPQAGEGERLGIGTVRYPRIVPKDDQCAKELKKRTLTNLYNQRPTWLDLAHKKLDQAVFAAYGWDPGIFDEDLLAKLLDLNLQRAADEA